MDRVRQRLLSLGSLVQEQLELATDHVMHRRGGELVEARAVHVRTEKLEQEIEEECLHILALHQPVAFDLRELVSTLKMNAQLHRIGDLSWNLVKQADLLQRKPGPAEAPFDLVTMVDTTRAMLELALDAVSDLDAELAKRVRAMDDTVDVIHRGMYPAVTAAIRCHPEHGGALMLMISISRQYERIADYARSIAKDVQYLAGGEIVRHVKRDAPARPAEPG